MQKAIMVLFLTIAKCAISLAHVGSPGVLMEGNAGPYRVLVNVIPPDVIPGVANVTVYVQYGSVKSIGLRAIDFRSGDEGAPKPEAMKVVAAQPGQYTGELWLMGVGSSSVQITVNGSQGKGDMIVPVVAVSTATKTMPASTGLLLAGMGIFLFVLLVTIIGSSVSDAVTKEGELLTERRKRIRWVGIAIAAVISSLLVFGGHTWWQSLARNYKQNMFIPAQAASEVKNVNGANELLISLDTNSQRSASFPYIVPDHGKMMHLFIMRIPSMDAFAHLHPIRVNKANFKTILPGLPKGKYLIFADIVYNTGFTETIKDTISIATDLNDNLHKLDNEDAYAFAMPADLIDRGYIAEGENTIVCGKPGTGVKLKDGSTMVWESMTDHAFESGKLYKLKFTVISPDGKPAMLDPYLGMPGHAAVVRNDGNVYIHLHPVGTYSMAAEKGFHKRIEDPRGVYQTPDPESFRDSIDNVVKQLWSMNEKEREKILMAQMNMPAMEADSMKMDHSGMIAFPYAFPTPGKYRVWVQVKRNGQVLTAAFDKLVEN